LKEINTRSETAQTAHIPGTNGMPHLELKSRRRAHAAEHLANCVSETFASHDTKAHDNSEVMAVTPPGGENS
jgi:hypothetical protein